MTAKRSGIVALVGSIAAVVAWAGVAWACTAVAEVEIVGDAGRPGSQTVVKGRLFESGPVQLRWNSKDGPLLATATGPEFVMPVTIPDVPAGVSHIVGVQRDSEGTLWNVPGAYQVLAPGESASGSSAAAAGSSLSDRPAASGGDSSTVAGIGLLSVGLAVLAAACAAAQVRRRRATAPLRITE